MITSLKTCFKCGGAKELSEFYAHRQMADGHLNKCKACTKLDSAIRYRDPAARERIRQYDKDRESSEARKANKRIYQARLRQKWPEKTKARQAVSNAVRDGRLTKKPCEVCKDPASQAHHNDYRHPLAVRWLCFKHHRALAHSQQV